MRFELVILKNLQERICPEEFMGGVDFVKGAAESANIQRGVRCEGWVVHSGGVGRWLPEVRWPCFFSEVPNLDFNTANSFNWGQMPQASADGEAIDH